MFHKLVKFVHINIREKLGGQIAERETNARLPRTKTLNNLSEKPDNFLAGALTRQSTKQNFMVNVREKLPDVALQNPAGFGVVLAHFTTKRTESVYGFVRSFTDAAGIGIGDKSSVKERIKNAIDGVVKQTVADLGLVDVSRLGVGNVESLIWAVLVCLVAKFRVEE